VLVTPDFTWNPIGCRADRTWFLTDRTDPRRLREGTDELDTDKIDEAIEEMVPRSYVMGKASEGVAELVEQRRSFRPAPVVSRSRCQADEGEISGSRCGRTA